MSDRLPRGLVDNPAAGGAPNSPAAPLSRYARESLLEARAEVASWEGDDWKVEPILSAEDREILAEVFDTAAGIKKEPRG